MKRLSPRARRILSLLFLAVGILLEAWFTLAAAKGNASGLFLGLLHLLAAILVYIGFRLRLFTLEEPEHESIASMAHEISDGKLTAGAILQKARSDAAPSVVGRIAPGANQETKQDWSRIALPIALFLPGFGVFGLAVITLFESRTRSAKESLFAEYRDYIRYRVEQRPFYEKVDPDELAHRKLAVEPIADLLSDRDKAITRSSIEVLSKLTDDRAVALIKQTLDDPDVDIKFYSSWGLDRIEERHQSELKPLKKELTQEFSREIAIKYLQALHQFLLSGIPDDLEMHTYIDESDRITERLLNDDPEDAAAMALAARTARIAGRTQQSAALFAVLHQEKLLSSEFALDFAEVLLKEGLVEEAASVMREFVKTPENSRFLRGWPIDADLQSLGEFWGYQP